MQNIHSLDLYIVAVLSKCFKRHFFDFNFFLNNDDIYLTLKFGTSNIKIFLIIYIFLSFRKGSKSILLSADTI